MQSAKKSSKVLSALAVAAAAAAAAQTAHAASLTLFYGSDTTYSNSNNGLYTGTTYGFVGTNTFGQNQFLGGTVAGTPANIGSPTTINVAVGSYLSIAIDAVLTGNQNSAKGTKQVGDGYTQPTWLGLSALGLNVASSDATGTYLTPISTATAPSTTINGLPSYLSTANINQGIGANGNASGSTATTSLGQGWAPAWNPTATAPGDVQPNQPGFDTAPNSTGSVGLGATSASAGAFPFGGQTGANGSATGTNTAKAPKAGLLQQFAAGNNVASYANATDFLDSLAFTALKPGLVTLQPNVLAGATQYWTFNGTAPVGGLTTSTYAPTSFGANDSIGTLPTLVINITGGVTTPTGHAILNYAGAANSLYAPSLGTLTVTGSNGHYSVASMAVPATTNIGTTEAHTFTPASDEEIWAYDVLVNGSQASASQLATLVTEINTGDVAAGVPASAGVVATTTAPVPNPFAATGTYNLYIDPSGFSDAFLGIDLTPGNDSNLAGYTISRVAVVPEPMTLGLLALGGVGLMARRHRRKA
jgi:hypothetical protein